MSAHVGDDAELYALGMVEQDEREAIDAHLKSCAQCSKRVGRAERIVVGLDAIALEEWPNVYRAAPLRARWLTAAAAFALALGLGAALAGERAYVASIVSSDGFVVKTLANAHFLHAAFIPDVPNAPSAKVLYARDGAWLYVIVDAARSDWRVAGNASGTELDLGLLQTRGTTSVLLARPARPVEKLRLIDARGVVIEHVETLHLARNTLRKAWRSSNVSDIR